MDDDKKQNNSALKTASALDFGNSQINTGVLLAPPVEGDWIAGGITGIPYEVRVDDWTPYLPAPEAQYGHYLDSQACVTFSALNTLETQLNWLLSTNQIPASALTFFTDHGYIENGKFNCSDRFIAKVSGTTMQGNYATKVWDAIRHFGLVPESVWPFDREKFDWDAYYADIPQAVLDLGTEFLTHCETVYEFVGSNPDVNTVELLGKHIKQSPLQILTAVCPGWGSANPVPTCNQVVQHATTLYHQGSDKDIFDHYIPFQKYLALDYLIPYALKGLITFKEITTMEKFWPQANFILSVFTGKDNNEPDATTLAKYLRTGEVDNAKALINKYRTQFAIGTDAEKRLSEIRKLLG